MKATTEIARQFSLEDNDEIRITRLYTDEESEARFDVEPKGHNIDGAARMLLGPIVDLSNVDLDDNFSDALKDLRNARAALFDSETEVNSDLLTASEFETMLYAAEIYAEQASADADETETLRVVDANNDEYEMDFPSSDEGRECPLCGQIMYQDGCASGHIAFAIIE